MRRVNLYAGPSDCTGGALFVLREGIHRKAVFCPRPLKAGVTVLAIRFCHGTLKGTDRLLC